MVSGCCSNTAVQPVDNFPEDEGPSKHRQCTDIIFLIIFLGFLAGMGYVSYLAIDNGNPNLVRYGYDSWGNICGQNNENLNISAQFAGRNMVDRPKAFFFNQMYFMSALPSTGLTRDPDPMIVCIAKCPYKSLPLAADVNNFATETGTHLCRYDISSYVSNSTLCPVLPVTPHLSLLNRCIPSSMFQIASSVASSFSSMASSDVAQSIATDIVLSWREILYMAAMAFGASFLVVILLRLFAGVIVWLIVILTTLLFLAAAGYSWYKWYLLDKVYQETSPTKRTPEQEDLLRTWLIYSLITSAVAIVVVLILLVMRKRIKLVVKLFKETGRVITNMPLLILQPIWTLLILLAAVAGLLLIALYIETSKVPVVRPSGFVKYQIIELMKYLRWYHLFGIFWISAFIVACQDLVIAGAVSIWYFTRDKTKLGCPIGRSTCNLIRYHIGSVAFGSFLIALVRFVRFILMLIQKKLKGKTNKFAEFLMKMLACCLWCFERFLKFINRNAYIMIAIHGDNFCNGARKALVTIVNNALRVIAINTVGDFLLFLSKLGCVALVLIISNEFLPFHPDLTYKYVPLMFGGVIAFAIAHCFMLVYEIALDTIFMCFCEDCDMNNGTDKPYFMSRNLMTCVSNIETFKDRSPKSSPKSPRKK